MHDNRRALLAQATQQPTIWMLTLLESSKAFFLLIVGLVIDDDSSHIRPFTIQQAVCRSPFVADQIFQIKFLLASCLPSLQIPALTSFCSLN